MARKTFYDFGPILTYNAVYNGVIGGRGLGKTFGAKERCIKDAIKHGKQFILLRRYKEEMAEAKSTFFADIAHKFPDYEFRVVGREAQMSPVLEDVEGETEKEKKDRDKAREWSVIGYFIALSTAQRMKGTSFPLVFTILFDEFIIEKGNMRYLPSEVTAFNNFYSTVDRWQDRVKVFFLANSVRINNPYFIEWKIRPDQDGEFVKRDNGFIVFHFPDSAQFQSEVFATRFGQFIKGTEYAEYAVGNTFSDNHNMLIDTKDYRSTYMFSLETPSGIFSLWRLRDETVSPFGASTKYYVQAKRPRKEAIFTIVPEKMGEDKILLTFRDKPLETLRTAFRTANVFFDEPSTRNIFIEIFDRK